MRSRSPLNLESQHRLELFARQNRSRLTASEAALWSALKRRQLGVSFRRQVPLLGLFIADFFASSVGLVVEVDDTSPTRRNHADAQRDLKLRRVGIRVLRISAALVVRDLAEAVALGGAFLRANKVRFATWISGCATTPPAECALRWRGVHLARWAIGDGELCEQNKVRFASWILACAKAAPAE